MLAKKLLQWPRWLIDAITPWKLDEFSIYLAHIYTRCIDILVPNYRDFELLAMEKLAKKVKSSKHCNSFLSHCISQSAMLKNINGGVEVNCSNSKNHDACLHVSHWSAVKNCMSACYEKQFSQNTLSQSAMVLLDVFPWEQCVALGATGHKEILSCHTDVVFVLNEYTFYEHQAYSCDSVTCVK